MPPSFFFVMSIIIIIINPSQQSQVSISLSPTILNKSGDPVLIKWSGINSPSELDWLGIYSPPNSPHDYFIGYVFLSKSPTWKSGSGSISLPLINLRSNYAFRIFRWTESEIDPSKLDADHNPIPGTAHLLASSEELSFKPGHGPEQIHLAFTDDEDEMRVMYVTADPQETYVRYGRREDKLDIVAVARVKRYEREDMCDSPANSSIGWRDPGYIHDGVMTNLKKGVRYYYKVGNDAGGWSATHNFMSRNNGFEETIAFLFGDMGTATPYSTFSRTQDESIATVNWILRDIAALGEKPAFVSHIGDISYARGYAWLWDQFFTQIEPIASKLAYHVSIGNHEYNWPSQPWKPDWASNVYGTDGGGECGIPYSLRFNMPGNSSDPTGTDAPSTRNLYYSFDVGAVHFVYISTETNFLPGSSQYDFLKHDLESVDRSKTPFVVVQGHRPMYTSNLEIRDAPLRQKMLEHLEPLFVKNKVTLALWGHVHKYERFCPLNNFTCGGIDPYENGGEALPVHVVIGMAGQDWQPKWEPRPDHPDDPIFPQPKWSLYRGLEFGYTRLVATKEKLTLSYVGNHDGELHDMVEILVSGQVISGNGNGGIGDDKENEESRLSWFVKGAIILVVGAVIGYVIGVISYSWRKVKGKGGWIQVKAEDSS